MLPFRRGQFRAITHQQQEPTQPDHLNEAAKQLNPNSGPFFIFQFS
jgi:hypothetical protein